MRTLLLAGALLSALPLVVEIPLAPRPLPERIFALITLFALCGYWIRGHRRQSFPLWIEPVEALAIYLIASCSKADVLLLPLLGLIFQASYGTLWRSLRLAALYSVALWGASFTGIELTHSEAVSRDVGQFLGVALVRLILHAVQREELGVELLKLYRDVKDHALLMLDPDGRVSTWDDGAEEIYGHPADYAIGRPLDLLFPPIGMLEGGARQELEAAERSGIARTEVLQQRADGSTFQAEITTTALKDGEGRLRGYSRLVQDLTERRRAHEALEESRAQLQAVVGVAPIVLWAVDANGRVVFCEGKQLEQIGVNPREVVGGPAEPVLGRWPTLLEAHRRAQAGKPGNATNEVDGLIFDAQCIPRFDEHGRVTGVIGVATDVTDRVQARREQEQLQAQLAQAQRLESIGKLAGGVAHDFNNLLTVVISCASFLGKRIPAGDPLREDVDEIMEAAERGSNLTRQLLAFGRRQPGAPRVLDLGEVVHDLHKLLQRTVGEQIELVLEDGDMRPHVRADLGQLEQVVMNLVVNARDALEQHGRIVVRTDQVTIRPGDQSVLDPLPAGEYARLTVRDNGPGISEDVASRAFEPFFTTKPRGQGTGLGLATVHGIVKQAAGQVDLRPTQGGGTIATVLLPAASDAVEPDLKPAVLAPASGGGERVLVVDDELSVAGAAERILSDHGYEVTKVTDPVSALDVLSSSPFDLLLSDVVMPQLSGGQLAERAASLRPELKVLFMTGYADAELLASCPADRLVQKPFSECDLVNRVRGALKAAA